MFWFSQNLHLNSSLLKSHCQMCTENYFMKQEYEISVKFIKDRFPTVTV